MIQYENIPQELKERKQWVNWSMDPSSEKKPLNPNEYGKNASPTDPTTWGTFETVMDNAYNSNWSVGIGFVVTKDDPYVCIDLDFPKKVFDPLERQRILKIHDDLLTDCNHTYAEISPSGNGKHIWLRSEQKFGGFRSPDDCIEIYADQRYMTFTGIARPGTAEIREHEELITVLRSVLEKRARPVDVVEKPREMTPEQVIAKIQTYQHAAKFVELAEMPFSGIDKDQNTIDQGVMNFIVHACENVELAIETFYLTPRGKRKKWIEKPHYRMLTVKRAFDFRDMTNGVPVMDFTQLYKNEIEKQRVDAEVRQQIQQAEVAPKAQDTQTAYVKPINPKKNASGLINGSGPFTNPGGLVGEIMDYFYRSAYRPIPEVALAGALGVMAGVCGRAFNVETMGLNLYIILLAKTGVGKNVAIQSPADLIERVAFRNAEFRKFIGGRAASAQALMKSFGKKGGPSFCSFYDEFGELFKRMSNERDNPHMAALLGPIMELYSQSGRKGSLPETLHSKAEDSTQKVKAPSYSFVGASVPETFYESLNPQMATKGLLPRLSIINYDGDIVRPNKNAYRVQPSDSMLDKLYTVCTIAHNINEMGFNHQPQQVVFTDEADDKASEFADYCDEQAKRFTDDGVMRALWTRVSEKVKRIAALIAVGHNPYNPIIDETMLNWAINFGLHDVETVQRKVDAGETGTPDNEKERIAHMKQAFRKFLAGSSAQRPRWPELQSMGYVPKAFLISYLSARAAFKTPQRAFSTASQAIELTIRTLIGFDQIELATGKTYSDGTPFGSAAYRIKDPTWLND